MTPEERYGVKFTPTEQRILELLSDGHPHSRKEIHACLWDDLTNVTTIKNHISKIRGKVRPSGEEIVCEIYMRTVHYRHVLLITSKST